MLHYPLEIRLFGCCEVRLHGLPLPRMRSRKGLLLLVYMTLHADKPVERAAVAEYLWPESDAMTAQDNLKRTLVDLRGALGPEAGRIYLPRRGALCMDLTDCYVDVLMFDRKAKSAAPSAWREAIELYAQPLLEGWGHREGEAWIAGEREKRRQILQSIVEKCLDFGENISDTMQTRRLLTHYALRHPPEQTLWRRLLKTLLDKQDYPTFHQIYQELMQRLEQWGGELDPETLTLFHAIPLSHRFPSRCKQKTSAPALDQALSDQEAHNTQVMLEWLLSFPPESPENAAGLHLVNALAFYWETKGLLKTGREWIRRALAQSADRPSRLRAALISQAIHMPEIWDTPGELLAMAEESVAFWRADGDREGIARALSSLGWAQKKEGGPPLALHSYEESLRLWREIGNEREIAAALYHLANNIISAGECERAEAMYTESLRLYRKLGEQRGIVQVLMHLSNLACNRDAFEKTVAYLEEGERLADQLGDRFHQAQFSLCFGSLLLRKKRLDEAEARFLQALHLFQQQDLQLHSANALGLLVGVARKRGDTARARRLLKRCLDTQRALHAWVDVAYTLGSLGELQQESGNYDKARAYYEESLRYHQRQNFAGGIALMQTKLVELDLLEGRAGDHAAKLRRCLHYYETMGHISMVAYIRQLLQTAMPS